MREFVMQGLTHLSRNGFLVGIAMIVCLTTELSAQNFDYCYQCTGTTGECEYPAIAANPPLTAKCSEMDIILIIDESGSVDSFRQNVQQGVLLFVNALVGSGVDMAVIEFSGLPPSNNVDTSARVITDYVPVDNTLLNNMTGYFNQVPFNGQTYNPFEGTNWMKAFETALTLDTADLILFFTDGNPTVYTNSNGMPDRCGNGFTTQRPEIVNPMLVSNYIKEMEGTHVFMMGVGRAQDSLALRDNLERVSGPVEWGQGSNDIQTSDYAITDFATLADQLRAFAIEICGTETEIALPLNPDSTCIGETVQFTFEVSNTGTENPASNIIIRDTFPAGLSGFQVISGSGVCIGTGCDPDEPANVMVWTIANIPPQGSATITIQATTTTAGTLTTTAWATGQNINLNSVSTNVFVAPALDANIQSDQTICEGNSATLTATGAGGSGEYDFAWSTTQTGSVITVSPAQTTTYTVTVTDEYACDDTDQVVVTIQDAPELNLVDADTSCTSGPIVLNPGGNATYTYLWSPAEFLNNPNAPSPVATVDETTTFFVTVTTGVCTITDQVTISVAELPDTGLNPSDTSCFGSPVVLNPGGNVNYTYQWSPAQFLNDPQLPSPIAEISESTLFIVTITDQTALECQRVDSVFVLVPPDVHLGAPDDTAYCGNAAITLTATGNAVEYVWYTTDGAEIGTGTTITVQPEEETVYILEGTDIYGCQVQQTVTVTPTLFDITPSDIPILCAGETGLLSIENNDPTQELTYLWAPAFGIVGSNTGSSVVIFPPGNTTYTVTVTNAALGCSQTETFEVEVSSFDPPELVITVNDDSIGLTDEFILSTNQDPNLFYFWDGPGIVNPNLPVITAIPDVAGVYTYAVTITNSDHCQLFGTIRNLVVFDPLCSSEDIFVPDAFSPNGDGENELLFVYGNYITAFELRIFNRWGEQVFSSNDQTIGWDGTFDGKELSPEVFGYYLRVECPPDKQYFTKGNITLFK